MIRDGTKLAALYRWLCPRRQNICITFGTPQGKATLRYLAKYCHASSPTEGDREQGRRDVWLYLQRFLKLNEEELAILYGALTPEERYQIHKPSTTYYEAE
jgi:hypothetical protein